MSTSFSGNSHGSHRALRNKLSHVKSLANAQWALLCGLTSPAPVDPQHASNRHGVENHTTELNSVPLTFAHHVPPVVFLAPTLLQEREDHFQLAGQVPHNLTSLHRNSRPYTRADCSLSTQVPCAPVLVDDSPTLVGAFDLSHHLDPPVNCVCLLFLSSGMPH